MRDEDLGREELQAELEDLRRRVEGLESENASLRKQRLGGDEEPPASTFGTVDQLSLPCRHELRQTENDHSKVLQSASEAICITQDGLLKFANRAGTELTGYSENELLSMTFAALVYPEDREELARIYMLRLRREHVAPGRRFRVISKIGAVRWVESWSASITWNGGPAVLFLLREVTRQVQQEERLRLSHIELDRRIQEKTAELQAINDKLMREVREREKAEVSVRESEDRFRMLMEHSPMGIAVTGTKGEVEYLNKKFTQLFGYTRKDLPTLEHWLHLAYPDPEHGERVRSEWLRATKESAEKGTEAEPVEREVRCKDGTIRVIDFRKTAIDQWIIHTFHDLTDKKCHEAALLESEQMFRLLSEQSLLSVAILQDGVYKYANQAMSDLCEYSLKEILDWRPDEFLQVVHPADRSLVMEQAGMKQIGHPRQKTHYEFRITTKSGAEKWVDIYSKTVPFQGRPANLLTMLDITERHRAEEALQESEERFRTAFQTSPDSVTISRLSDGIYVDVNRGFSELTGFTRDQVIGKSSLELNLWNDPHERNRLVAGLNENGQVRNLEAKFRYKDGQIRTGLMSARIVLLDAEPYILSVTRDVTDWKKAEEALLESEKRYRELFDNSADLIYTHDVEGNYTSVNKAVERLLGYTPKEMLNLNFRQIVSPEYLEVTEEYFRMKMKGQSDQTGPYEAMVHTKSGRPLWLEVNGRIMVSHGRRIGIHGTARDITDRKLAQEKLKQEQEFTEAVLRSVPGLLCLFDEAGHIVRWNKQIEELSGYSAEEVTAMHLFDLFGGCEPDTFLIAQRVQDVMTKGIATAEANLITKDGKAVPFYFTGVKLTIAGKPYFTGIGIDITDRRRSEAHIRLNEARLQSLYDISQHPAESIQGVLDFTLNEAVKLTESEVGYIFYYDEERQVFELNTWSRDVMKECEVAERRTLFELAKTGIWGEAIRQRQAVVVNDFHAPNPLRKGYPGGHLELHNFMTIPVFWRDKIVAVIGVANKATDYDESDVRQLTLLMDSVWRIAEARRSELEQRRSATALEYAAEGVIITDPDGTIRYVNPSLEKMTGYSREELLGNNPRVLKSGVQDKAFYEQLWQKIKSGDTWTGRFVNRRKDGTLYTEDATISPVRDDSGQITNFVGMKRDISDQLALSKQLFHSQKMEAIGTLAGGIAHDVNNLLQAVLGYADLLLMKKGPSDPDRKKLEVIRHAARDGADLVSRILTFCRKTESKARPIDLNNEIRGSERLLRRTLPRMIQIDLRLADDLRIIDADPAQVEQILLNLGVNAQHAMPDGGRLLIETSNVSLSDEYMRTHLATRKGNYVVLTVSDTGIGMEPDVVDRIFEPFFTTRTNGMGTGLGLAMVHGIIAQHGGFIRCYSEPGKGTSFKMYFPVSANEQLRAVAETREMPAFGDETILLVDDDDRVREMAQEMIRERGYRVLIARNGEEALEIFAAHTDDISLVILDLNMPGMGGKKCLGELLRIDPKVRVLVASGYSSGGLSEAEEGGGASGFISKPYDAKGLLGAMRKVLDRGHL